ncbi:MAG: hypothetical protein MI919_16290 [Holophagales bacterium]|nr:hypothetical protein [Holophagales bacterium]
MVGRIGEGIIYGLLRLFGRRLEKAEVSWLAGPIGGDHIGDRPYEETAEAEGLILERQARSGGLLPDFSVLRSSTFDPDRVDPRIRELYEQTARFSFDTWATTYLPARIALWLLVQTISRRVDQLNFPLDGLDSARGMTSEIVLLRRPDGTLVYTGWFRRLRNSGRSIYTGFYMTEVIPGQEGRCVKVVFPMPGGNATVLLRPENAENGGLRLVSVGSSFGDVGFYRLGQLRDDQLRVWRLDSLHEVFELYVDEDTVRCDHRIRFLGLPVLALHYKMSERPSLPGPGSGKHGNVDLRES